MPFDFDTVVDRRGTHALKWNGPEGEIPMWVADMDIPTAPCVREAIERRAAHGIFGYTELSDAWCEAYQNWWGKRHGLNIERESLLFATGVISAIASIIRSVTSPADKILVQSPVYNMFYQVIRANGREVVENVLTYEDGAYAVDYADLEAKLSAPALTMMILCNPHNPIGKTWDRETLLKIGTLARKHNVLVLSDEIHCDLTDPGCDYTPYASLSEEFATHSVTCITPTKAFNMAGLHTAAVVVSDPTLRARIEEGLHTDEVASPNAFAVDAAIVAMNEGGAWLDELRTYLAENKRVVRAFIETHIPAVKVVPSDATYLLWLDVREVTENGDALAAHLREVAGLRLAGGAAYGTGGAHFLRLNPACPRATLLEGLRRLEEGILSFGK